MLLELDDTLELDEIDELTELELRLDELVPLHEPPAVQAVSQWAPVPGA